MAAKQQQSAGGNDRRVQVDIVIVGSGPATLGLLTNACKSNRLNELVAKGDGIAVIDQGMTLGGGCLAKFGLNSNTSANGFIKCLYKRRELPNLAQAQAVVNGANAAAAQNSKSGTASAQGSPNPRRFLKAGSGAPAAENGASPVRTKLKDMTNQGLDEGDSDEDAMDEEDVYQPKKYEYIALNPFKDLYKLSPLIQMSFEFGPSCIPLNTVGMILDYTGNHLLHFIHTVLGKRIFFPQHRVVSVQLMNNGDIITTAMRKEISIVMKEKPVEGDDLGPQSITDAVAAENKAKEPPYTIVNHGEVQVSFRSKAVVLSNGGEQNIHPDFYSWFPFLKTRTEDVLLSDYVLQKEGYMETVERIKNLNKKKIVIIGGSHSGFSTAWILLNGPADILHNTHVKPSVQYVKENTGKFEFPGAPIRSIDNCQRCCVCHYTPKKQRKGPCRCVCKCYGFFRYSDWGVDFNDLPQFEKGDITILYRDRIRVFYSRVHQAQGDGYNDYKQLQFSNKNGFLYSFTGLRGDAKRMYKAIKAGTEQRVRLVKAATPADQAKYLEGADLVIWACGYQTNRIPVKDIDNKVIQMSAKVPFTQFDVDQRCRIITSDNGLLMKTFGSGLAYPVRTNDGMILPEAGKVNPRADSFSLYMNYVANTLLANLLPKTRLQNKNHRTIRLGNKKTLAAQAASRETAGALSGGTGMGAASVTRVATSSAAASGWVRSGSEHNPQRSNTLSRPIQSKPSNTGVTGTMQNVNISKVQSSPIKTSPTKSPAKAMPAQPVKQASQSQPKTSSFAIEPTSMVNNNEASGEGGESQPSVPGYLRSNYITEGRKAAAESSAPRKKSNWVPSSQFAGPPINKIPKDTTKALEQRIAFENQKNEQLKQTLDSTIPSTVPDTSLKAPTYIQMHLSESGQAFQAVSQSFAMLQANQLAQQQQQQQQQLHNRYTLRTTEFKGKFPGEQLGANAHPNATAPDFIKNFTAAQQSYGIGFSGNLGTGAPVIQNTNVLMAENKAAGSPERLPIGGMYSTPQKNSAAKAAQGYFAASPLVYTQNNNVVDNTPQVHKRKASFKMVKSSTTKQEEFGQFTASVLADQRYSPAKPRDAGNVKSIDVTSGDSIGENNLYQLLASQHAINKQQQQVAPGGANLHHVTGPAPPTDLAQAVKPVSSNGFKRHPATAAHQQSQGGGSKKKSIQSSSKHFNDKVRGVTNLIGQQTGTSSNSTNNTTVMSNQKSSPNIHKSKRAGTFLKNCKTKFQAGTAMPVEIKQGGGGVGVAGQGAEKNLSHLASAGQRQIFSDESGSVSSANRPINSLQEKSAEVRGLMLNADFANANNEVAVTTIDHHQMQDGSMIMHSQTPKNLTKAGVPVVSKVQSSQSNKRRTNFQNIDAQRNIPLNDNFVKSEEAQSPTHGVTSTPQTIQEQQRSTMLDGQNKQILSQDSDLQGLQHKREFSETQDGTPQRQLSGQQPQQRDSILTQEYFKTTDAETSNINKIQERTFNVKRTSGFGQGNSQQVFHNNDGKEQKQTICHNLINKQQQLSPQSPKLRPSSRQKSASRTHRSPSKNQKISSHDGSQTNIRPVETNGYGMPMNNSINLNNVGVVVKTQPNVIQQVPPPHLQAQNLEKSFNNNGLYSMTNNNPQPNSATIFVNNTNTNGIFRLNSTNNDNSPGVSSQAGTSSASQSAAQQQRKSTSSYDVHGRLQSMCNQTNSSSIVPVKIFQLPVQKKTHVNNATAVQAHYMQQILMNQVPINASQSHGHGQSHALQSAISQQFNSPQPNNKKSALSHHHTMHMNGGQPSSVGQSVISIIPPQTSHTRNPPQSIQIDSAKMQGSQTQIAQYGLMHVANPQNKPKQSHQIIVGNQNNMYQGRSQQLPNQVQYIPNGSHVVRKPVAAQMQMFSSQVKTTTAKTEPQTGTNFKPIQINQHQHAKAQPQHMSYSNSQQMQQLQQMQIVKNPQASVVGGAPPPRNFEINSPVTLKSKHQKPQQHQQMMGPKTMLPSEGGPLHSKQGGTLAGQGARGSIGAQKVQPQLQGSGQKQRQHLAQAAPSNM